MKTEIIYSKDAFADLRQLDGNDTERIVKKINFWSQQESPLHFAKPLKGLRGNIYRFRVGNYRIIFEPQKNGQIHVLFILRIRHRREVYRL